MTRTDRFLRRLSVEPLERRQLLCGSAASGSALQSIAQSALLAKSHSSSVVAVATNHRNNDSGGGSQTSESFLVTPLTDTTGTIVGTASYETDTSGNQILVITVVGAAASTSYAVNINGNDVGTALTTDANGNGRLILTSAASTTSSSAASKLSGNCGGDNGATTGALPDGFTLAAGATIALTSSDTSASELDGTFAASTGNIGEGNGGGDDDGGCHHGDNGATFTRSIATLSDSANASGKAVFSTITHSDGTTDEVLRVRVTGAASSTTLDISIDDTLVGTLTTDANGNGYAIFSSNPKNSNVGQLPAGLSTSPTAITVGTTITGTFNSSSSSGSSSSLAATSRFLFHRR
jgi:hypothetical protein